MKNITKTLLVLVSSSLISFASVAGELTVTGAAKASYVINGGNSNNLNKGLGVSNELMFAASGELDNGYTWNYHTELDMADGGAASNDDTALVFGLGDLGKFGIYDAEGGLSTELSYGIGAVGTGQDEANTMVSLGGWGYDVSSDPHIEYHMPADLLPAGISIAVGYAPNTSDGQGNSYKNGGGVVTGGATGTGAQQIKVTAAPIEGLSLAADYYEVTNTTGTNVGQNKSGGNVSFQYAMGNFKVGAMTGYGENGIVDKAATAAADTATASNAEQYLTTGMGIEFAVNDNLSVSYQVEQNERNDKTLAANGGTTYVDNKVEAEADIFQIAYNIGGATLGIFHVDTDNSDYVTGKEENKTVFSAIMAF